jgi:signal transduction histidine kinase
MDDDLIHKLRAALLKTSKKMGQDLYDSLMKHILEVVECSMCSLWSINNDNENNKFQSVSLIARYLKDDIKYDFTNEKDYVHELKPDDCFTSYALGYTKRTGKHYFLCDNDETINKVHKSPECISELNLRAFIGIPIPDFTDEKKMIAILKISHTIMPKIAEIEDFSSIIRDYFSSSLYHNMLLKKQQIMDDLIQNYQERGQKKIDDKFYHIINTIFPIYCQSEGISVFIWDSYMNHYRLLYTTGLKGIEKKDYMTVFYLAGEGFTGKVAKEKESIIYNDLATEGYTEHKHKSQENTKHTGKTMLVVPILRPSNAEEVIGILRFVNKINIKGKVVDYFNDRDEQLITYASNYLALTIDNLLDEEEKRDIISKISHEFSTPANAIRLTADRIMRKMGDPVFITHSLYPYLQSIKTYSELQFMQASTNLYISKIHRNIPKKQKYNPAYHSIKNILRRSINTVIPFARESNVQFSNITIDNDFPAWRLYVDEFAFVTVFYNLLTNTIKYVNPKTDFWVHITGKETEEHLIINVSDNGLGILKEDIEKVFLLGFRGKNVVNYNMEGFGIGLHVIYHIIQDFEGEIRVVHCCSPTTFEIVLPKYLLNDNYINKERWNS